MRENIEKLISKCNSIDFGEVHLTEGHREFYRRLNHEILSLSNTLPESTRSEALLFLMRYSGIPINDESEFIKKYRMPSWLIIYWLAHLKSKTKDMIPIVDSFDFFRKYKVPVWSIIYWLTQLGLETRKLTEDDEENAITGHALAMKLHSLDDHLLDNEVPATPITLLLRSHLWGVMNSAFSALTIDVEGGENIVQSFIDQYYSGLSESDKTATLDDYCERFKDQMSIGFIVPVLLAKKIDNNDEFVGGIQTSFGSFGIAWRLLDDIQDMGSDIKRGTKSAFYTYLSENFKNRFNMIKKKDPDENNDYAVSIYDYILKHRIVDKIKQRITIELESAAKIAGLNNMAGLADEFKSLSHYRHRGCHAKDE